MLSAPWESCRGITLSAEFGGSRSANVFPAFRPKPDMVGFNHRVLSHPPVAVTDGIGIRSPAIGRVVPSKSILDHSASPDERTHGIRQTRQPSVKSVSHSVNPSNRWCLMPSGDISRNLS